MAKKRVIALRIELTGSAKERLTDLSDQTGMTQVQVASRIIEWFTEQPDLIQAAVLGRYPPEIEADVARLIMHRVQLPPDDEDDGREAPPN
jgi:hypothetical protein